MVGYEASMRQALPRKGWTGREIGEGRKRAAVNRNIGRLVRVLSSSRIFLREANRVYPVLLNVESALATISNFHNSSGRGRRNAFTISGLTSQLSNSVVPCSRTFPGILKSENCLSAKWGEKNNIAIPVSLIFNIMEVNYTSIDKVHGHTIMCCFFWRILIYDFSRNMLICLCGGSQPWLDALCSGQFNSI